MKSVICTLFEKSYHLGVGALCNSLLYNGFKGDIYAGYRGDLPPWIKDFSRVNTTMDWDGAVSISLDSYSFLHLLPLDTTHHLTNYKPDFMTLLIEGPAKNADALFYYDPDIIQNRPWTDMEDWVKSGIAVAMDINDRKEQFHPIRCGWRSYFKPYGIFLNFKTDAYVNGGFIGLTKENYKFIYLWKTMQDYMEKRIGGLEKSFLTGDHKLDPSQVGAFGIFAKTDQDVINAAIEATDCTISCLPRDAMAFDYGIELIPHAIGPFKPWNTNYFKQWIISGRLPRIVDNVYWRHVQKPIKLFSATYVKLSQLKIHIISLLGRFYSNH